ncbi:MAG: hypothetical protein V1913_07350 [Fibrobacterota bacterium]
MKIIALFLALAVPLCALTRTIDQVAARSGKYFLVPATLAIPAGDTLVVPQGSELLFSPLAGITLSGGVLLATGTRAEPVFFSSVQDTSGTAAPFDWIGVDLQPGSSARFSFACIAHSTSGITAADSAAVTLDSCVFTSNGQWSLSLKGVMAQIEDNKPYSYAFVPPAPLPVPQTPHNRGGGLSRTASRAFLACGIAAAAVGTYFLVSASNTLESYNAYVPGNALFDQSSPSARQQTFDAYRTTYKTNTIVGWSLIGAGVAEIAFITLKNKVKNIK